MRITNSMLINNMTNYIGKNLQRMDKYQQMLANGKKIAVPSDDPVIAARALKLRTDLAEVNQYDRNVDDATSWIETTEGVLSNVGDVLQRVRELTVQCSSGQFVGDDLDKINEEIKQLKTQLINLGNTTYAGRYIFSGYSTDKKLLNDDGTFAVSVTSNEKIKYEIGIGDNININVLGGDLFNSAYDAAGDTSGYIVGSEITFPLTIDVTNDSFDISVDGEPDVSITLTNGTYANIDNLISEIQDKIDSELDSSRVSVSKLNGSLVVSSGKKGGESSIIINATSEAAPALGLDSVTTTAGSNGTIGSLMENMNELIDRISRGDNSTIGEMIDIIDNEMNNVIRIRADIGARQNRLELTSNRLQADVINFTKLMSENEDVDMARVIMDLKNEENVYKASLSGGARVIMPTLMDFLR